MLNSYSLLSTEMRGLAQATLLAWFSNDMRIRVSGHSPVQRRITLLQIREGLNAALMKYEADAILGPAADEPLLRASLYRSAFNDIAFELMAVMSSGFNAQELAVIGESATGAGAPPIAE